MKNNPVIQKDIMRYKKNKLSSSLALLGLAFGCLYFLQIYGQYGTAVQNYFYKIHLGASVIYNLIFLLAVFYCSEGVKNYKTSFCYVLLVIAAIQVGRIFYFPLQSYNAGAISGVALTLCVVWLALSAASIAAAGAIGLIRGIQHKQFNAEIENGTVDIDAALAEEDDAEEVQ
jgi:FtsH-binding integral membrane protein